MSKIDSKYFRTKQNPVILTATTSAPKTETLIDYILVIKDTNLPLVQTYIESLKALGLKTETVTGMSIDLVFIKVFISEEALKHFSEVYEIGNEEVRNITILYTESIYPSPFKTPVSKIRPKATGEITSAERVMIVNKVLENAKFGEHEKDYGVSKLIRLNILETAYPLHDGPIVPDGKNVRSLLFKHWSNTGVIHKEQPLDLIYRYYGPEIAFYFAWLEYFNLMLIIPAILGGLIFIGSLVFVAYGDSTEIREICQNQNVMCPTCEGDPSCTFRPVSTYCTLIQWTIVFDNHSTIAYAIFMSFWAIVFLNLWRRKQNKLKMRWHADFEDLDTNLRQAYVDGAKYKQRNPITGEIEPFTPKIIKICKSVLSFTACAFSIGIIFVAVIVIVALKRLFNKWCERSNSHFLSTHSTILTMCFGSLVQVFCIKMFAMFYGPLSISLTNFENPPTQHDFDNSVLYKRYLLSFTNNYVALFYLAFVKGRLYTVPHESSFFSRDVCQPTNCIFGLCLQLLFLMTLKDMAGNLLNISYMTLKNNFQKLVKYLIKTFKWSDKEETVIPQWEEEYYLQPTNRYLLTTEFTEMIIKYGLITFFVAAFPLAPWCALMNNILEIRSDAYKLVKIFRRPVPLLKNGIGAWDGVLLSVTYLSTASNAFVVAFTSDWVAREVYRHNTADGKLVGYVNSTLSKYDISDYDAYQSLKNVSLYCYYRGYYYSADDQKEYQYNQAYWMNVTFRFAAVFAFEHIILMCNTVLSYCIPKSPTSVTEVLDLDQKAERAARLSDLEKTLGKNEKVDTDKINLTIKLHQD